MKVIKFGGSSLASATQLKKVFQIEKRIHNVRWLSYLLQANAQKLMTK